MTTPDCEQIINLAIENGEQNASVKEHCRKCSECAATLACLMMLQKAGSPTGNLKPSPAFLQAIDKGITSSLAKSASSWLSAKTILTAALASALALTVAFKIFSHDPSTENASQVSTTGKIINSETLAPGSTGSSESQKETLQAPILHFKSPADDVDQ